MMTVHGFSLQVAACRLQVAIGRLFSTEDCSLPISVLLPFLLLGSVSLSPAQTNIPPARSNRYLLIVETSRSMQRRSDGVLRSVQDLLGSKMGGQLTNGDTVGVWTYNEDLGKEHLPVQRWSLDTDQMVTGRILAFLKAQKYEKRGQFEKVLPALSRLIKNSDTLTTLLISDGAEEIKGTPFDERINGAFKLWHSQQQEARMPFVIVLRAQKGQLTDCTVNPAPWVVELPPLPPEPQPAKVITKRQIAPAPKSSAPPLPPLIITGKKPEPQTSLKPAETNLPLTTTATTAQNPEQALAPQPLPLSAASQTQVLTPNQQISAPAVLPQPLSAASSPGSEPVLVDAKNQASQSAAKPTLSQSKNQASGEVSHSQFVADSVSNPISSAMGQANFPSKSPIGAHADPIAVVVPHSSSQASMLLWIAMGSLAILAAASLVWIWHSRSRPRAPSSFITESFHRNRK